MKKNPLLLLVVALFSNATAQALPLNVDTRIEAVMPKVVEWRRDFHQQRALLQQWRQHRHPGVYNLFQEVHSR